MSTAAQITDVTRTCQNDISTAALVGALEAAWSAIAPSTPKSRPPSSWSAPAPPRR